MTQMCPATAIPTGALGVTSGVSGVGAAVCVLCSVGCGACAPCITTGRVVLNGTRRDKCRLGRSCKCHGCKTAVITGPEGDRDTSRLLCAKRC